MKRNTGRVPSAWSTNHPTEQPHPQAKGVQHPDAGELHDARSLSFHLETSVSGGRTPLADRDHRASSMIRVCTAARARSSHERLCYGQLGERPPQRPKDPESHFQDPVPRDAPARRSLGTSPVASTTEEGSPSQVPPSSTSATPGRPAASSSAAIAGGSPCRLALVVAMGPNGRHDGERHGVGRAAHADRRVLLAQVGRHVRPGGGERSSAPPARSGVHQPRGRSRDGVGSASACSTPSTNSTQLHVARPSLDPEEPVGRPGVPRVGSQAVHRVGGQTRRCRLSRSASDRAATACGVGGSPPASRTLLNPGPRCPPPRTRATRTRCRPARSATTCTSAKPASRASPARGRTWSGAISTHRPPRPARSQAGAPRRISSWRSRPSGPASRATVGSQSAHLRVQRRPSPPRRRRAGWTPRRRVGPRSSPGAPPTSSRGRAGPGPPRRPPIPARLARATSSAGDETSVAHTSTPGRSAAMDSAIAPDPVPRSTRRWRPLHAASARRRCGRARPTPTSTTCSVSGRGISTRGSTIRSSRGTPTSRARTAAARRRPRRRPAISENRSTAAGDIGRPGPPGQAGRTPPRPSSGPPGRRRGWPRRARGALPVTGARRSDRELAARAARRRSSPASWRARSSAMRASTISSSSPSRTLSSL